MNILLAGDERFRDVCRQFGEVSVLKKGGEISGIDWADVAVVVAEDDFWTGYLMCELSSNDVPVIMIYRGRLPDHVSGFGNVIKTIKWVDGVVLNDLDDALTEVFS